MIWILSNFWMEEGRKNQFRCRVVISFVTWSRCSLCRKLGNFFVIFVYKFNQRRWTIVWRWWTCGMILKIIWWRIAMKIVRSCEDSGHSRRRRSTQRGRITRRWGRTRRRTKSHHNLEFVFHPNRSNHD